MKARLTFFVEAPSAELAMDIAQGAVKEFGASHPGVLQSPTPDKSVWLTELKSMRMDIVVVCQSQSDGISMNNELDRLFSKHQKATGVNAAPLGASALVTKKAAESKKKWWPFSR